MPPCSRVGRASTSSRPRARSRASAEAVAPPPLYRECCWSQASTASATSRQPLSIVSEWPRSGNSSRSVTAGRGNRPALVELVGLLRRERVAEAVAELLRGQRDRPLLVGRIPQRDRRDPQRRRRQEDDALDRRR